MLKFLDGYKTYITMAVIIILAVINGWNEYCGGLIEAPNWCIDIAIPEYVFAILGALGIYTRKVAKPK